MPAPAPMKNNLKDMIFHDYVTIFKNLDALSTQYVGESTFNEKSAHELIISKDDASFHLYVEKETLLPAGVKYSTVGQQGPTEVEEYLSDYREVDGMMIAFKSMTFEKDNKISGVTVLEAKADIEVDMSIFEKK